MDESTAYSETAAKDTCRVSSVSSPCFESSHIADICASCQKKNIANMTPLEVVGASSVSKTDEVIELGNGILPGGRVPGICSQPSGLNAAFDQDEIASLEESKICKDFSNSVSLDGKKDLKKYATFPFSAEVHTDASSFEEHDGLPSRDRHGQHSNAVGNPAYERSISLPSSLKLVSAMKGGRAQNGNPPTMKLNVKWAPDVYEPPSSTMSHTVKKYHQQRPKAKRKNHKQKHKGKSSRGGGNERKHMNKSCINGAPLPHNTRMQEIEDKLHLDGYGESNAEMLEYGIGSQESKCGSSFMREALGKVHFSTAEAS